MEKARHLLVVDDDRDIQELLHDFLVRHGFRVSRAADGREMRRVLAQWPIDGVILDLMLPGEDGMSLCRYLRAQSSQLPIIMLTAVADEADRVIGLELGADDYLVKPFSPRELLARIRAIFRRSGGGGGNPEASRNEIWTFAGWRLDLGQRELRAPDGVLVHLSTGEYQILKQLLERPQRVIPREEMLDHYKGDSSVPFDRSIDIQISRLRRKLDVTGRESNLIKTVRGVGYQFTAAVVREE
ncbi:response regulator [Lacibacterium aquatile]|uniref:Response regulator n=1 Tax=Lacibacterium aquatile TaxID=1168082 RepID=A0ABW5DVC0_9PROT